MKCYITFLHTCGSYNIGKWHTKKDKNEDAANPRQGGTGQNKHVIIYLIFFSHNVWCSATIATVSNKKARINERPFFYLPATFPLSRKLLSWKLQLLEARYWVKRYT